MDEMIKSIEASYFESEHFKNVLGQAVSAVIKEEFGKLYIGREEHYKQHLFISEVMEYCKSCKSLALKTVLIFFISGVLALLGIGFAIKYNGN